MKVKLICVGKTGKAFLEEGEKHYKNRLKHYVSFEMIVLPDVKNAKKLTEEQIKDKEGELILNKINSNERIILLDENGKTFSSTEFADFIQKQFNQGGHGIVFVIGGPYGFSEELCKKSYAKVSLSRLTFSHQMVRMFFIEQLYRAMTILKGEPYHHT